MGLVLIFHSIYFKIDTIMLSLMKSSVDVGIYGAPYKILEVLLTVPVMFLGNIFPTLTKYLETNDERLPKLFQQSFEILWMIAVPLVVGALVLAQPILTFVAGPEYVAASTLTLFGQPATGVHALQILIFAVGLSFFSNLFNYLLIASGRQRSLILPNRLGVLINVGLNLVLIPSFSYIGAAATTVFTELAVVLALGALVARDLALRPSFRDLLRSAAAAGVMGGLVWLTRDQPLFLTVPLGMVSYPAALVAFRALPAEFVRAVLRRPLN